VIAIAVLSLTFLGFASAASAGPDAYLCKATTARGAIPQTFAAEACFDGKTLTIRNDLQIPMSVEVRGDVGKPSRTETDFGIAAEATRAVSSDPRMLLPGDTLRFPIGGGAAGVRLTAGKYADFYDLASTVAGFLPGDAGSKINAVTAFVRELNEDFVKYHECRDGAKHSHSREVGCHISLVRNVGFAAGRAGLTGLTKGALAVIASTVTFDKWFEATLGNLKALIHSGTIRLTALPTPSTPTAYGVPLSSLCANQAVRIQAINGCPYPGATLIGSTNFAYAVLVENNNESVSPTYWNLIDFPASTCTSIQLTFGLPSSGSRPGDSASIEVVGAGGTRLAAANVTYGSVATLSAELDDERWKLENSASDTEDEIAINGVATCSTSGGY
jgi:hypothetical protein